MGQGTRKDDMGQGTRTASREVFFWVVKESKVKRKGFTGTNEEEMYSVSNEVTRAEHFQGAVFQMI